MKLDERLAATKIYLRLGKIAVLKKSIPVNEDKMQGVWMWQKIKQARVFIWKSMY